MDEATAWKIAEEKCDEYQAASNSGDADIYSQQFTEDAIWVPPGRQMARSAAEILEAERPGYERNILELTIRPFDVQALSESAISVLFDVGGSVVEKESASRRDVSLTGMNIIVRQPDDSWKIHRQVWNAKPAE